MTKLEKMSDEWCLKNRDLNLNGEGAFCMSEAYLAGFKAAREMAHESLRGIIAPHAGPEIQMKVNLTLEHLGEDQGY
jgi:hypothetical protein